jgi:hypothetical protein
MAYVWLCFRGEQARLGAFAERFRPGRQFWAVEFWPAYHFWGISTLTLFLGSLAFGLGVLRERILAAKKNGGGEL